MLVLPLPPLASLTSAEEDAVDRARPIEKLMGTPRPNESVSIAKACH
jgi:hypothetical protein